MVGQGSSLTASALAPSHGRCADALRPSMRQLNRELGGADPAAIRHDAAERVLAVIRIKPKATMGDAAVTLDMRRFDHQETRAGIRKHSEMRHVPVVTDAVIGAVLAHRRNDDPVRKVEIGKFYGREQSARHRSSHAQLEGGTQFERAISLSMNFASCG